MIKKLKKMIFYLFKIMNKEAFLGNKNLRFLKNSNSWLKLLLKPEISPKHMTPWSAFLYLYPDYNVFYLIYT